MRLPKRVYVAGAYSADNVLGVLKNMNLGINASKDILLAGYAPFCPWLDYQFLLAIKSGEEITLDMLYRYSLSWLQGSDYLYVLPNFETSRGTIEEIKFAHEIGIPVFYNFNDLVEFDMQEEADRLLKED